MFWYFEVAVYQNENVHNREGKVFSLIKYCNVGHNITNSGHRLY